MPRSPAQYDIGEDREAGLPLAVRQRQCDGPAALTVAVDDGLLAAMALRHDVDETGQGLDHRSHGLAWDRLGVEDDEIGRVPFEQRHADLGITLESADARPVPGPRIHHDHRRRAAPHMLFQRVGAAAGDAQQAVVRGRRALAPFGNGLGFEVQQRRHAGLGVLPHVVGAFAQGVHRHQAAPHCVGPVAWQGVEGRER
jgi:hypothetical protein